MRFNDIRLNRIHGKFEDLLNKGEKLDMFIANISDLICYTDEASGYMNVVIGRRDMISFLGIDDSGCPGNNGPTYYDFCRYIQAICKNPQGVEGWDRMFNKSVKEIIEEDILYHSGDEYELNKWEIGQVRWDGNMVNLEVKIRMEIKA